MRVCVRVCVWIGGGDRIKNRSGSMGASFRSVSVKGHCVALVQFVGPFRIFPVGN